MGHPNGLEFDESGSLKKKPALDKMGSGEGGGGGDPTLLKTQQSTDTAAQQPQERVPALPVLVFCVSYITFGAALFSAWESWSFLEGFYFSFITLTTIGTAIF